MATINNLEEAANTFLQNSAISDLGNGVQYAVSKALSTDLVTNEEITAFTSSTNDVILDDQAFSLNPSSNNVILTGTADLKVTADADNNIIVANDGSNTIDAGAGNDQVSTGKGDDSISLGEGDDTVEINGGGTKSIDGGAGNDTFIIKPTTDSGDASTTTFTGLNRGDAVKVTVSDANGDGKLDFDDVEVTTTENGSVSFQLKDGSSFTLDGVGSASATNGDINYTVIDNGDGTFDVELT